jgi:head-tail adaptor
MIINPDKFRHRVGIYLRQQTPDSDAGITYDNTLISEVWASIEPTKGSAYLYKQNLPKNANTRIIIRDPQPYNVTSENWIRYAPKSFRANLSCTNDPLITITLYRILDVKNIYQLDRFLELACEEYNQT